MGATRRVWACTITRVNAVCRAVALHDVRRAFARTHMRALRFGTPRVPTRGICYLLDGSLPPTWRTAAAHVRTDYTARSATHRATGTRNAHTLRQTTWRTRSRGHDAFRWPHEHTVCRSYVLHHQLYHRLLLTYRQRSATSVPIPTSYSPALSYLPATGTTDMLPFPRSRDTCCDATPNI